jgi:hypothetical protein
VIVVSALFLDGVRRRRSSGGEVVLRWERGSEGHQLEGGSNRVGVGDLTTLKHNNMTRKLEALQL